MSLEDEIVAQIRLQFEEDRINTDKLQRANKIVELINPIMVRRPLTHHDINEVFQISKDYGFSDIKEVFAIRKKIQFL